MWIHPDYGYPYRRLYWTIFSPLKKFNLVLNIQKTGIALGDYGIHNKDEV